MRNLIELNQKNKIVCDNPTCDFVITNDTEDSLQDDTSEYIDVPCPNCGENLLTQKDYDDYYRLLRIINWINKYFSWINFFVPKSTKPTNFDIKVRDGYEVIKPKEDEKIN